MPQPPFRQARSPLATGPSVPAAAPAPAATTGRGPWAWYAGAGLVVLAAAQQTVLALGGGGALPGWQPWPYLLVGAPLLWWGRHRCPPMSVWRAPFTALRRIPAGLWLAAVLALTAVCWAALQNGEPWMGHEEAVYANRARSWTDPHVPAAGWGTYRPVGLPALGVIALHLHDGVGALRAVALLLVPATLTAAFLAGAR